MKMIAFYNNKGGVGKTSTAINIAYTLSRRQNRILLVDFDGQCNSSRFFTDLANDECGCESAIVNAEEMPLIKSTRYDNIDIVTSSVRMNSISNYFANLSDEEKQTNIIKFRQSDYDYIIVDMPPAMNDFVISGIKITCHDGTIDYEMPKIKSKDGNYYDMAVPLNDRFGQLLKEKVLSEYGLLSTQILCGNINHAELTAEGEVAYKLFKNNSIAQKVINQLSERNIKYSAKINARETTICFLKSDFETMREISLKAASETENHKKL